MSAKDSVIKVVVCATVLAATQLAPSKAMAKTEVISDSSETSSVVSVESRKERRRRLSEARALQGQVENSSVEQNQAKRSTVKPGYDNKADLNFGMHPSWMLGI